MKAITIDFEHILTNKIFLALLSGIIAVLFMFLDTEYNSRQFYRGDENNSEGKQVPGYFLLNISAEYSVPYLNAPEGFSTVFFFEGRNLLEENFETGGILAENEVDGTGGSGTFVTPGQPFTIFGGMRMVW